MLHKMLYKYEYVYNFQGEIDARGDSFHSTADSGQKLFESEHYAKDEVKQKVCHSYYYQQNLSFRALVNLQEQTVVITSVNASYKQIMMKLIA